MPAFKQVFSPGCALLLSMDSQLESPPQLPPHSSVLRS